MTQNRDTGAKAARFGRKAAALIAEQIGAKKLTRNSNEFLFRSKRATIMTARLGNDQFGVLYEMLDRVDLVIGAFEIAPGEFELRSLTPKESRAEMRDSPTNKGRVGLVRKRVFESNGTIVKRVKIAI